MLTGSAGGLGGAPAIEADRARARLAVALVAAAVVAAAFLAAGSAAWGGRAGAPVAADAGASALFVRVAYSPRQLVAGEQVRWRVRLTNRGGVPSTLVFPTSGRADVVLRRAGVARYRWSDAQVFAPVLAVRTLAAGATWTFVLPGALDVPPGRYELVATIAARPAPRPAHARVVIVTG